MRLSIRHAAFAVTAVAALVLSACGGAGNAPASSTSSSDISTSSDSAASVSDANNAESSTDSDTSSESSSGSDSSTSTSETQSSSASTADSSTSSAGTTVEAQPAPEGWKMVKTGNSPLSFAVPADWVDLSASVSDEDAQAALEGAGVPAEVAQDSLSKRGMTDLMFVSLNPEAPGDSFYTLSVVLPEAAFASDDLLKKQLEVGGLSISTITKEPSPVGEVRLLETEREGFHIAILIIPTGDGKAISFYSASIDQQRAKDNARTVISTLTK
ncbi:MAG: hypothetical protein Q4C87_01250 [Actinomycetaceae bacterium]|nr:hypothetical protein [Actinomycetaceae bacterium]